jgi:hypothetical protein
MNWQNADYSVEIDDVFGNESSLDLGTNMSVTRRFQMRQVVMDGKDDFDPIPFALAKLIFYDYVLRHERVYVDLPFKQIRFIEDKEKIGEIFDAEVVYALDYQKNTDQEQEFTLPTFSMMGGKKKQLLPVITYESTSIFGNGELTSEDEPLSEDELKDKRKKAINKVERHTKELSRKTLGGVTTITYEKPIEYKMIGWDGKKFNGVELEAPELKMMIPAWYPSSAMLPKFFKRLMEFVGTVNSEDFYGLEPGECKYLGPEQSWVTRTIQMNDDDTPTLLHVMELQHHFQVELNQEDVEMGDIKIDKIPGWDYVDVHYKEALVDIGDGKKVPQAVPKQVDIVPVYARKDLWELFNGKILEDLWEGPPL